MTPEPEPPIDEPIEVVGTYVDAIPVVGTYVDALDIVGITDK